MFYLETKDGDRFFTSVHSDDKAEFDRIIEDKLGEQASAMFNDLLYTAEEDGYDRGAEDGAESAEQGAAIDLYEEEQKREQAMIRITDIINDLNKLLQGDSIDNSDIEACVAELESINRDLE